MFDRYDQLESSLALYDLEIRNDSVLCEEYIAYDIYNGPIIEGLNDLESVVEMMKEMHFFFTHTKYEEYITYKCCYKSNSELAKYAALSTYINENNANEEKIPKRFIGISITKFAEALNEIKSMKSDYNELRFDFSCSDSSYSSDDY
jgi:hypothetical protein